MSVDSSVLGVACDGYEHRYRELRDQQHEPGLFVLDIGTYQTTRATPHHASSQSGEFNGSYLLFQWSPARRCSTRQRASASSRCVSSP